MAAPSTVEPEQLLELGIRIRQESKKEEKREERKEKAEK
jgi:hypothetical protein